MRKSCILAARRTPIGRYLGSLASLSPVDLAVHGSLAALERFPREAIDQVIVGNVLGAGQGMNMAGQLSRRLELRETTPAFTVNMMCGSGMQAILLGMQAIATGQADVVLCGGTESMSQAPHLVSRDQVGGKLGPVRVKEKLSDEDASVDCILRDGLIDPIAGEHMAATAQRLADAQGISREQQDAFAALSQLRCKASQEAGVYDGQIVPLHQLACDEHPRPGTSAAQLAELKPVFDKHGSITAGNASGINDGAAMLVLASEQVARDRRWPVAARITGGTVVGCDPARMGMGPVFAIRKLLPALGLAMKDFDMLEINEAFAAQTLACVKELRLRTEDINQCGGAIALGHPIGATGARLVVHMVHEIMSERAQRGLASLCIGGGMGAAIAIERGA